MNDFEFEVTNVVYGLINDLIEEEKTEVLSVLNKNEKWNDLLSLIS